MNREKYDRKKSMSQKRVLALASDCTHTHTPSKQKPFIARARLHVTTLHGICLKALLLLLILFAPARCSRQDTQNRQTCASGIHPDRPCFRRPPPARSSF